jgi:hypothetical protein
VAKVALPVPPVAAAQAVGLELDEREALVPRQAIAAGVRQQGAGERAPLVEEVGHAPLREAELARHLGRGTPQVRDAEQDLQLLGMEGAEHLHERSALDDLADRMEVLPPSPVEQSHDVGRVEGREVEGQALPA